MKIYCYDRISRQFVGDMLADSDPMEPGKYLLPAFSTVAAPPAAPAGTVAVFTDKGTWSVEAIEESAPAPAAPAPTLTQRIAVWRADVREFVNVVAVAYDFDSIDEAVSYADEPAVPTYQALGSALRAWRSLLWQAFDAVVYEIGGGAAEIPADKADLIARLPPFVSPDMAAAQAAITPPTETQTAE